MKKILIIIAVFILSGRVFSQPGHGFGFKAGISFPNLILKNNLTNPAVETSNNIGFNFGLFYDIYRYKNLTLNSEFFYSRDAVGIKITSGNPNFENSVDYKIEYLIYGLSASYDFGKRSITPYVFGGPRAKFYISDGFNGTSDVIQSGTQITVTDNLKKFIFALVIGAGFEIKASKNLAIFAESSYSPGLFKTYEDINVSARTNSLEIKIGGHYLY